MVEKKYTNMSDFNLKSPHMFSKVDIMFEYFTITYSLFVTIITLLLSLLLTFVIMKKYKREPFLFLSITLPLYCKHTVSRVGYHIKN